MSSRNEFVPQSSAATRVTSTHCDARPVSAPVVKAFQRLVAERVDARPDRERVRHEHVQALHPAGHPAGGHRGAERRDGVASRQVVLVRGEVTRRKLLIVVESLGHLPHQARCLEPPDRGSGARTGEVEQGRERRAVLEPRRGLHDVRQPAGAAMRDLPGGARRALELGGDRRPVGRRDVRLRRHLVEVAFPVVALRAVALPAVSNDCQNCAYHGPVAVGPGRLASACADALGRSEPDVAGLARQRVVQSLTGLRLDVRRALPSLVLRVQATGA